MLYGISEQDGDGIVPYGLNMSIDLVYDQCYSLHAKTASFCFTFVLVIVNPIILVLVLKIT